MKMIREPSGVIAYTWVEDGENSHWEKVGEVLGGTNNKTNEGQMFEGKVTRTRMFLLCNFYVTCSFLGLRLRLFCGRGRWKTTG